MYGMHSAYLDRRDTLNPPGKGAKPLFLQLHRPPIKSSKLVCRNTGEGPSGTATIATRQKPDRGSCSGNCKFETNATGHRRYPLIFNEGAPTD